MIAQRVIRITTTTAALAALATLGACAQAGGLGNILGGVLAPQNGTQVSATIQSVDTRSQVINLQQSNGQNASIYYDNRTKVLYQNQLYPVTSLEYGDQVMAHILDQGNNTYYTDSVYVTQPVNGGGSTYPSNTYPNTTSVQSLQGTVRQVDFNAGQFTIDSGNGVTLTVSMPYRASSQDQNRFNNLRVGNYVRFNGVFLNNTRVELRQFN
jgi:hypothetical protein